MALPTARVRPRQVLALLVMTALALMTLDFRDVGAISSARRGVLTVFDPLVNLTGSVGSFGSDTWNGITDYDDVTAENELLRAELERVRANGALEQDARVALDEVLGQADIATASGTDQVLARVISGPVSNFENTLRLDKGTRDGVQRGMTVVAAAGLVGRVAEATPSRSVVELADGRDFAVGVRQAGQNRRSFVARGQGRGEDLLLQGDVGADAHLANGDLLLTSGLDLSVFPPDIPVGRVAGVAFDDAGEQIGDVRLELSADPNALTFVTVVDWESG